MQKFIACFAIATLFAASYKIATAEGLYGISSVSTSSNDATSSIQEVYNHIDFGSNKKLSFDAFKSAYTGFINLKEAGKLNNSKSLLSVVDFTLSSCEKRLWIIDLKEYKVVLNDYVAHGQGSGDEFATNFSNNENSHQSSIGFYVTGNTYVGQHGTSLHLNGMDEGYNSAAYQRAVVVHGADYVSPQFISGQKRLGRSWGCPAVSNQIIGKVIDLIKDGTCLFLYYPQKNYLAKGYWINKKISNLPGEDGFGLRMASAKKDTVYQYIASAAQKRFMEEFDLASIRKVLP